MKTTTEKRGRKKKMNRNLTICYMKDKGQIYDYNTNKYRPYTLADLAELFNTGKDNICHIIERHQDEYKKLSPTSVDKINVGDYTQGKVGTADK